MLSQLVSVIGMLLALTLTPAEAGWIRIDRTRRDADPDLTDMVFRFLKKKYSSKIKRVSVMAGAFSQNQEIEFL